MPVGPSDESAAPTPPPRGGSGRSLLALGLLGLVGLFFFWELLLQPTQTLYSDYSDLLSLHLPSKKFLVRSWRETGELPLWCPYNFGGMPFVHDIQVSAFYPPHWLLFLVPEERVGAALNWLVVAHVIAAGWCMFAYARYQGLGRLGAFVAAAGWMFAGKWLLHLLGGGHYNMVPLAWLPLMLLWLEQAVRSGSYLRATWAGAVYALFVLGAYPYLTLYAGLFAALWTLGPALEGAESWGQKLRAVRTWLVMGLWAATVAVALGAVQLLPSLEAARYASRTAGVGFSTDSLAGGVRTLAALVGPPLTRDVNWFWEDRAGLGLLWLAAAVVAPLLRPDRRVMIQARATLVWVVAALGGVLLLQGLPGFNLFQLPSRMLLVAALPVALFAGVTTEALFADPGPAASVRRRCGAVVLRLSLPVLGVTALMAGLVWWGGGRLAFPAYWVTLLITAPAAACFLLGRPAWLVRCRPAWALLLLVDLWALGRPLVELRSEEEVYAPSACCRFLAAHREEHGRVLEVNSPDESANATPLWPGLPAVLQVEPVRGFNPIDVLRYKEYLQFVAGGEGELRPLDRMYTSAVLGTFPVENQSLADLLGIRYLLLPADVPLEAVVKQEEARRAWTKVAEDPAPTTFNFIPRKPNGEDGGLRPLRPCAVYENRQALPRAFFADESVMRPGRLPAERSEELQALRAMDFRRRVLLDSGQCGDHTAVAGARREAVLREYRPNRVVVDVDCEAPGFLVLTDVWYPGWVCEVDGVRDRLGRANYLFRCVKVEAGTHRVVFRFEPASYRWGKLISLGAAAGFAGLSLVSLWRRCAGGATHA